MNEFLSVDNGGVTYICQNLPEKRGIIQKFVLNLLNWISAKKDSYLFIQLESLYPLVIVKISSTFFYLLFSHTFLFLPFFPLYWIKENRLPNDSNTCLHLCVITRTYSHGFTAFLNFDQRQRSRNSKVH